MELMTDDAILLKDVCGRTAVHIAAWTGNTAVAKILIARLSDLLYTQHSGDHCPVHMAAYGGHKDTFEYLVSQTKNDVYPYPYAGRVGIKLLDEVIVSNFFDLALYLVDKCPYAVDMRSEEFCVPTENGQDNKLVDATRGSTLARGVHHIKDIHDKKLMHQQALQLVKCLCKHIEASPGKKAINSTAKATMNAVVLDNHEVVEIIVETFPHAIYSRMIAKNRNIFHVAIMNRSEKIYNLIYRMSGNKNHFLRTHDADGNSLLHMAAKLAPSQKLNTVSGAALQVQHEIQWFEEVKKIVHPYIIEQKINDLKSPHVVFTEEHAKLKEDGEKWILQTLLRLLQH